MVALIRWLVDALGGSSGWRGAAAISRVAKAKRLLSDAPTGETTPAILDSPTPWGVGRNLCLG
jgi:hypothetical protein